MDARTFEVTRRMVAGQYRGLVPMAHRLTPEGRTVARLFLMREAARAAGPVNVRSGATRRRVMRG
jgi:hypothetical protein